MKENTCWSRPKLKEVEEEMMINMRRSRQGRRMIHKNQLLFSNIHTLVSFKI
jgi:hypothetical protein